MRPSVNRSKIGVFLSTCWKTDYKWACFPNPSSTVLHRTSSWKPSLCLRIWLGRMCMPKIGWSWTWRRAGERARGHSEACDLACAGPLYIRQVQPCFKPGTSEECLPSSLTPMCVLGNYLSLEYQFLFAVSVCLGQCPSIKSPLAIGSVCPLIGPCKHFILMVEPFQPHAM